MTRLPADGQLPGDAVRRAARRLARRVVVTGIRTRLCLERGNGVRALDRRLAHRRLPVPTLLLLRADQRGRPDGAGSPPGCDLGRNPPRGNLPGAPALSALRRPEPGAACIRSTR